MTSELESTVKELYPDFPEVAVLTDDTFAKGYEIREHDGTFTVRYCRKTDFFRAVSVLSEKIGRNETGFVFSEVNKFDYCGIMVDVSRNAVLKVETVKDIIRYMAKMGLNQLMLYTEDTYKLDNYPYFGYMRGAYTKEEIREIVAYGNRFGVKTVPCIQTLAHLKKALQWDYAREIKDTDDILLVDEEKTYALIEEMIRTCRECYDSDVIHIGMDEADKLGSGVYRRKHGDESRFEILLKHLSRVMKIVEKYHFKAMMWSDMFFRISSPDGEYYTYDVNFPESVTSRIPENLSMVYWDYCYANPKVSDCMIKCHKKLDRECIYAGGIWTWSGLSVNYSQTFATLRAALPNCIKHGVKNVFATMWGDDGAECSVYTGLLGMQLMAEYNYAENPDDAQVGRMFKACTSCDMEAFYALSFDTFPPEVCGHVAMPTKQSFYNDILLGLMDVDLSLYDFKTHYTGVLQRLEGLEDQGRFAYLFDYYRLFAKILISKCDMGKRLSDAYNAHDRKALETMAEELYGLWENCSKMHDMLADIWHKNNKPFGFEVLDARLGGVCARIRRAYLRVKAYLDGSEPSLPEFEAERLYFAKTGMKATAFSWEYGSAKIFSASM